MRRFLFIPLALIALVTATAQVRARSYSDTDIKQVKNLTLKALSTTSSVIKTTPNTDAAEVFGPVYHQDWTAFKLRFQGNYSRTKLQYILPEPPAIIVRPENRRRTRVVLVIYRGQAKNLSWRERS